LGAEATSGAARAEAPVKVMLVVGTRPEAIKLAPVILQARERSAVFETVVVTTGQHRQMLDQILEPFGIEPDVDLDIMRPDQSLCHVTTAALEGLYDTIGEHRPDWLVVQGDTSTTFAGALAAFYHHVRVAHVEAGLRTFDRKQPWPEEANRCLTAQVTDLHFPPTERARRNLLREGIPDERVLVTGNTAIDALLLSLDRSRARGERKEATGRTILLTAHRRENHGAPMESICRAVLRLLDAFSDLRVVYPVHMSPRVRRTVFPMLGEHPRVSLVDPMSYEPFIQAMDQAHLILTDSGGIQEEAPSLGKPVLVLRETTERPEAAEAGVARVARGAATAGGRGGVPAHVGGGQSLRRRQGFGADPRCPEPPMSRTRSCSLGERPCG
jgi:UDP-N-acetylglucosamine 2-epimerase (non-hydrolysing)